MRICTTLMLVAAFAAYEIVGPLNICLCATRVETCGCSPRDVATTAAKCCCDECPAGNDQIQPRPCRCGKPLPENLQPVVKDIRRLPESPLTLSAMTTAATEIKASFVQPFQPIGVLPYPSRSAQEIYCVWRE
ncbi:MAG: hypothetical protein L6306_06170 [Planctomycetales bacterium]|nr:hypothetical protein [Planctomycetales bacterium]